MVALAAVQDLSVYHTAVPVLAAAQAAQAIPVPAAIPATQVAVIPTQLRAADPVRVRVQAVVLVRAADPAQVPAANAPLAQACP